MKQTTLKFSGKKFIAAAFLSASLLLASFAGNAAINHNIELVSGEKSNVAITSSTTDALLFTLSVKNEKADKFIVTIKNEAGDILFSKAFSDATFEKQFKLLKDQDNTRYYVNIVSDNKNLEDTYVVSSTVRTVNDVAVNKL